MENNINSIEIFISIVFCLTPIALTIHLAIKKDKPKEYKKRLGYIYGALWAIAFLGYGWLFLT
ncbi:MAG: hypothetical protein ACFCAD_24970 [Pleurocapsa sp.]